MTCGLCRDCKHWGENEMGVEDWYRTCEISRNKWTEDDKRLARPADEYYSIQTKPDFGCNQFEAKQ